MPITREYVQGGDNYVVTHNNNNIWHLVLLTEGHIVTTGQDEIQSFSTLEEALNFIPEEYREGVWSEDLTQ